jgi:hypothetical protein
MKEEGGASQALTFATHFGGANQQANANRIDEY